MPNQEEVATYFKSINLNNVRCHEDITLDLTDESGNLAQWTLILGDNGSGKTTLLQCLGWMRPVFEGKANSKLGIGPALPREENVVLENLLRIGNDLEFKMLVLEKCHIRAISSAT